MKTKQVAAQHRVSPDAELALIRKKLKHFTTESLIKYWLDTGSPFLNSLFGSEEKGLPYGKMYELAGWESSGKTGLCLKLAGLAQKDGAEVGWVDLENSYDEEWAAALGVDTSQLALFRPEIGLFDKEKEERIASAEELLEELDLWLRMKRKKNPDGRLMVVLDSVPAMLTEEEAAAGIQDQNMRTKMALAPFLSRLLRRWVALVRSTNCIFIFINQLRVAPGQWGNPEYTPGGNAIKMYASVRVRMRRKSKKLLKGGKPVGIKGILTNWKNKAGGGSREGLRCGYKLYYVGKIKYVDADEIKSDGEEQK